jgi:hypothetical protein
MKRSKLLEIIKEVLSEDGAVGNVTGAMDGGMGSPKTPRAFAKPGQGENSATKIMKKDGFKTVARPKRPSNTKMFDYLDEMHFGTPHAFVTEAEMENSDAVKHTEEMGYKKVSKTNKASDKKNK